MNDICLCGTLVHLTCLSFYGSCLLTVSGKINTFSKSRCQLLGYLASAAERVGDHSAKEQVQQLWRTQAVGVQKTCPACA